MFIDYLEGEIGLIKIEGNDEYLTNIGIVTQKDEPQNPSTLTQLAVDQLHQYFDGHLKTFDLPLGFKSHPPFYQKVWTQLLQIPYGSTASYLDIAKKLGDSKATRAVGMANGKNPLAIVVPCHRVIGSNGDLTGYAYGTAIKRRLLALENPREYAVNGVLF